jgi:hypothetical protein
MNAESIDSKVAAARTELESTLNAIEDKLNVGKRVGELTEQAKSSYESNPVPWIIAAATAAVAVAGLVAWAILSDDD